MFLLNDARSYQLNLNFDVNISRPISMILVNSLHSAILQEYKFNQFTSINSKAGPRTAGPSDYQFDQMGCIPWTNSGLGKTGKIAGLDRN